MNRRSSLENLPSQTARIVALLRKRSPQWVSLPEILELRISQYSARIHQPRHEWGLPIENRTKVVHGEKHSWFRLVDTGDAKPFSNGVGDCSAAVIPPSLFGELAPERYPD
jgi:hypothetical protein